MVLLLLSLGGGCMQAAKVFLDLPDPVEGGGTRGGSVDAAVLDSILAVLQAAPEPPPAPVEGVADVDSILTLLPRDAAGGIDWVQALRDGVIRPRAYPAGGVRSDSATVFPFDFFLGDEDGSEAYFPHSAHVEWVNCQSCHPVVYRRRGETHTVTEVHSNASCATCHGAVAFPMQRCERCHAAASDLPAERVSPTQLGETYQLLRVPKGLGEDGNDPYAGYGDAYEPATFPHGKHRLLYQCRACHADPFPMQSGAFTISQSEAHGSAGCGYCHDGRAAFDISLSVCYRCHLEQSQGRR